MITKAALYVVMCATCTPFPASIHVAQGQYSRWKALEKCSVAEDAWNEQNKHLQRKVTTKKVTKKWQPGRYYWGTSTTGKKVQLWWEGHYLTETREETDVYPYARCGFYPREK